MFKKNCIKSILSVMLVIAMLVIQGTPVSAKVGGDSATQVVETDFNELVENGVLSGEFLETYTTQLNEAQNIEFACEAYKNLSPEAKSIFKAEISKNAELLEFHQTYVELDYIPKNRGIAIASATSGVLTALSNNLAAIEGLPTAVIYTLEAMGSAMVAAIADGPLPVGDILLAAATVTAAVVIAANWDKVSLVWDDVVGAFAKAFHTSAKNIRTAFVTIKSDTKTEVERNRPPVVVNGKEVFVAGSRYLCTDRAESLSGRDKDDYRYFPALRIGSVVLIDTRHGFVNQGSCMIFVYANNSRVGLFATKQAYARGICGGNQAIWHNFHDSNEGYYMHYHHPAFKNFHCWYIV